MRKFLKCCLFSLATLCFSLHSLDTSFATEAVHEEHGTAHRSFEVEFTEQSVKDYATFKGIKFDDAKETFGYKANYNRLKQIIPIVNKVTKYWKLGKEKKYVEKNCLATMLFATEIGLKINNFENCSKDDVRKMLYAIALLFKENDMKEETYDELQEDQDYNTGLSYIRGFFVYNMCQNVLNLNRFLSIKDNFISANGKLNEFLKNKLKANNDLENEINSSISEKYKIDAESLLYLALNGLNRSAHLDTEGTLDHELFSDLKNLFSIRTTGKGKKSILGEIKTLNIGASSIENEIISSKKSIFEQQIFKPNDTLKSIGYYSKQLNFIGTMFDVCRSYEHYSDTVGDRIRMFSEKSNNFYEIASKDEYKEIFNCDESIKVKNLVDAIVDEPISSFAIDKIKFCDDKICTGINEINICLTKKNMISDIDLQLLASINYLPVKYDFLQILPSGIQLENLLKNLRDIKKDVDSFSKKRKLQSEYLAQVNSLFVSKSKDYENLRILLRKLKNEINNNLENVFLF